VNRAKILGAEGYGPGELLPPHLSPWDGEGEVSRPWLEENGDAQTAGIEEEAEVDVSEDGEEVEEDEEDVDEEEDEAEPVYPPALLASALDPTNPTLLHAAELEAETNGVPHATFRTQLKEATKANKVVPVKIKEKTTASAPGRVKDEDLRKIMMSNKKAKLYEKMKYSNKEKQEEVSFRCWLDRLVC